MKSFTRLPTTAFAATYANGKTLRHPLLQLRVLRRGAGSETVNVAFAVGKKLGKATVRNTMRRRMRAAFFAETCRANSRAKPGNSGETLFEASSLSQSDSRGNDLDEDVSREYSHGGKPHWEKLRGANLIFLASPPALEADFVALRAAIAELTRRAAH